MKNVKFMQTIGLKIFKDLQIEANKRGIEVQEYIRAVVIPEHLHHLQFLSMPEKKYSQRAKKAWATRRKNALPKIKEPWEIRPEPLPSDQSS